jgi:hypothetical protein
MFLCIIINCRLLWKLIRKRNRLLRRKAFLLGFNPEGLTPSNRISLELDIGQSGQIPLGLDIGQSSIQEELDLHWSQAKSLDPELKLLQQSLYGNDLQDSNDIFNF